MDFSHHPNMPQALKDSISSWLSMDTCEESRKLVAKMISEDQMMLENIFCNRLKFGTAGLRALMGPGFSRLNDVTIQQTAQGYASFLLKKYGSECGDRGVVIGYDGRHKSKRFAHLSAATFLSKGIKVFIFSEPVPTPLVAFSLLQLKCIAGIVVTASHNSKEYNGYKIYTENGAQIISPMDGQIEQSILLNQILWPEIEGLFDRTSGLCRAQSFQEGLMSDPYAKMSELFVRRIAEDLCISKVQTAKSPLKVTYTAMHGVGYKLVQSLLSNFGLTTQLVVVKEQQFPDPEFPTVRFPNPEEAGALALSIACAERNGCCLVIANDPDADRFCAAEQIGGVWRQFTGDEMGIIFARYAMNIRQRQNVPKDKMLFVTSVVSSRRMQNLAKIEGCTFVDTLTGFKWMEAKAIELEKSQGYVPVCVYEEALGYALSSLVRDKDGVSAAAVFVQLACELHAKKQTVSDYLNEINETYGFFVTNNGYFTCTDISRLPEVFAALRNGGVYATSVKEFKIKSIRDVNANYDSTMPDGKCIFPVSNSSEILTIVFENGACVTLRTSGTEPKLKWYSELNDKSIDGLQERLDSFVRAVLLDNFKLGQFEFLSCPKWADAV